MWMACLGFVWWARMTINDQDIPPVPLWGQVYFLTFWIPLDSITARFLLSGGILAIALGIVQSVWEQVGSTWHFLLHRPISRHSILTSKLIAGLLLLMIFSAIPLALYVAWAATPGTHPSPFTWWLVAPVIKLWLTLPLMYLAAFQSGLLPNRWLGTRLLPCVAIVSLSVASLFLDFWWLTVFPVLCIVVFLQLKTLSHTFALKDF